MVLCAHMHHMIFLCGNPVKIKGIPLIVIEFVKRVDVCHHTVIKPVLVRILHPVYCDDVWKKEEHFENDLKDAVAAAGDYIMFGCDDVVFTHMFRLREAAAYLDSHDNVFGFSMRLLTGSQDMHAAASASPLKIR